MAGEYTIESQSDSRARAVAEAAAAQAAAARQAQAFRGLHHLDQGVAYTGQRFARAIVQVTAQFLVLDAALFAATLRDSFGRILGGHPRQPGSPPLGVFQVSVDASVLGGATIEAWQVVGGNLVSETRTLLAWGNSE